MKFYIKTFGCRVNIAESDELSKKLQKFYLPASAENADIIIVRACAVTAGAEQGVRQAIRNYAKRGKKIFVIGCFMEKIPEAEYFKTDKKLIEFIKKIKRLADTLRKINPLFNISADIIVGFPGETEADFKKTIALAKNLKLSKVHYFLYSPRPDTPASRRKPLSGNVLKNRLQKLKQLDIILQDKAKKMILGRGLTILFEGDKNFVYYGYTPNFIRIKARSKKNLTNKLLTIIIKKVNLI